MIQLVLSIVAAMALAQDARIPPRLTHYVAPVLSDLAKAAGAKGTVVIEATIDESGTVAEAHVIRSVPLLDRPALDAVKQWKYTPTTLNGKPVRTIATISVTLPIAAPFDLTGKWTVVSSKLGDGTARLDGPFGEGFTAVQTAEELTVDSPPLVAGRGGAPGRPVHVTYRLDGSVTNISKIGTMNVNANTGQVLGANSTSMSWTTASWVGERLQIQLHEQGGATEHVSSQTEIWQDADGTIEAERTLNPSGGSTGGAKMAWHAQYRRVEK